MRVAHTHEGEGGCVCVGVCVGQHVCSWRGVGVLVGCSAGLLACGGVAALHRCPCARLLRCHYALPLASPVLTTCLCRVYTISAMLPAHSSLLAAAVVLLAVLGACGVSAGPCQFQTADKHYFDFSALATDVDTKINGGNFVRARTYQPSSNARAPNSHHPHAMLTPRALLTSML